MTAYLTFAGVMGIVWVQLLAQFQDTPLTSCQTHTLCWWHFRWLSKDDRKYSFRSFLPPTTWPRHLRARRAVRSPGSDSLSTLLIDLPHGGSEKLSVSRSGLCLFIKVFIHYRHRPHKCVSRIFVPYIKLFLLYLLNFICWTSRTLCFIHLLVSQFSGFFSNHPLLQHVILMQKLSCW